VKQSDVVFANLFHGELIIIYSGKYLKYGRLVKNKKKEKNKHHEKKVMDLVLEKNKDKSILTDLNVTFGPKIEILKIFETLNKNWL